ncbi:hypothetical protein [Roseivivax lentus]|uniref:hypothetical protein n=1 Tax=Roseivivax lentus TaxID=633194 RepID=UPI00117B9DA9|nr:hypothetical protein [Roseivivax lentus]
MTSEKERYEELALNYLLAAQKLWKPDPSDYGDPNHLIAPTLQCLANAFELAFKSLLLAEGKSSEDIRKDYGHDLIKLWECEALKGPRKEMQISAMYNEFYEQFLVLSKRHMNSNGAKYLLRHPSEDRIMVYPPDDLIVAAKTILGSIIHEPNGVS